MIVKVSAPTRQVRGRVLTNHQKVRESLKIQFLADT